MYGGRCRIEKIIRRDEKDINLHILRINLELEKRGLSYHEINHGIHSFLKNISGTKMRIGHFMQSMYLES